MTRFFLCMILFLTTPALASETPASEADADGNVKVRYKSGKEINFEELLIQGQLQRPEISVVTGDSTQGTDGLLRLREDFIDQIASDIGESAR